METQAIPIRQGRGTPEEVSTISKTNGSTPELPKPLKVPQLDIVGTAEAASMLHVERPRIGRWIKRGIMPPTAAQLQATPVWRRKDIERMRKWVEANRRKEVLEEAEADG